MSNVFFISDTHFGHESCYKTFKLADGCTPLRPFADAAEGDEAMVELWNNVVSTKDTIYHLGDIVMNKKFLPILHRLKGIKKLIQGNHDALNASAYLSYFTDVRGMAEVDKFVLSHVPLHHAGISRWDANIHGHLHANIVHRKNMYGELEQDPKYLCVSVEQISYTPISIEEVKQRVKHNKETYGE